MFRKGSNSVLKKKVPARVLCADWSPDGYIIALGLFNGKLIIGDYQDRIIVIKEITQIE